MRLFPLFLTCSWGILFGGHGIGSVTLVSAAEVPSSTQPAEQTDAIEEQVAELSASEFLQELSKLTSSSADAESQYQILYRFTGYGIPMDQQNAVIEALVPLLKHEFPDIRALSAETLGNMKSAASVAIPSLIERLEDTDTTVRLDAVWTYASKALGKIGAASLEPVLASVPGSSRIKYYAITAIIADLGRQADQAAPLLIEQLRSGPENQRWATMFALLHLSPSVTASAIPDLIQQLDHENFNMQVMACRALAVHGAAAREAAPKLMQLIEKGVVSSRTHAAMCLAALGPIDGLDTLQVLMKMAEEKNAFCQERSMLGLGAMGTRAVPAVELIERLIKDEEFSQQPEGARALWQITGQAERSLEILAPLLNSPTYDARVLAVYADMGPAAAPALDAITTRLADEDQGIRLLALQALIKIGPAAKNRLDAMKARLGDSARDVVCALHEAISEIESQP